jgi:hypothetical protein
MRFRVYGESSSYKHYNETKCVYIRYQQMMALPTALVHLIDICTKVVNDIVHFVGYSN